MPVVQSDEATRSWGGTPGHVHTVQLYESDAFLVRVVCRTLSHALAIGAPVVAVVTPPHGVAIVAGLAEAGHDVTAAKHEGRLRIFDARTTLDLFMVRGKPDPRRFEDEVGPLIESCQAVNPHVPLHAFGEMVDLLAREGNHEAAIRLEELWNGVARTRRFSLLCAYGLMSFRGARDAPALERVCAEHARVVPAESYRPEDSAEARAREIVRLQQRALALDDALVARARVQRALADALREKDELIATIGHLRRVVAEPVAAEPAPRPVAGGATLRRVLIVDDNHDAAELLAELLEHHGHAVEVAHSAGEALALAGPLAPDFALLDLGLPEMDGFELGERLRQIGGATPPRIVAISGYGDATSRARTAGAGFEAHFVKPVQVDPLLHLLSTASPVLAA